MIPACCAFEYVVFGTKVGAYPGLAIVVTMAGVAIACAPARPPPAIAAARQPRR